MELGADWLKCLEQIHLCVCKCVCVRLSASQGLCRVACNGESLIGGGFCPEIRRKRSVDLAKQRPARCWSSMLSVLMMWCFHQAATARYLIIAVRWRPLIKHQRSICSIVMGWNEELIPGQHFEVKWACSLMCLRHQTTSHWAWWEMNLQWIAYL